MSANETTELQANDAALTSQSTTPQPLDHQSSVLAASDLAASCHSTTKSSEVVVDKRLADGETNAEPDAQPVSEKTTGSSTEDGSTGDIAKQESSDPQSEGNQVSTEQASTEQVSTEQASTEQASTERVSKEQVSTEQVSTEQVSTEQVSTEQVSTEQVSKEQVSKEQVSKEQVSKEQASRKQPTGEPQFTELALSSPVQKAIELSEYQTPTPIQAQIIPHMLEGRDVLAQSQTGTGKTAAFALPILSRIDLNRRKPQVLVLAPTRELAIQVANSFETYAACLDGVNIATIYGGQSYEPQLRQLRRGAHIVVGTPGRMIDHINQGTLDVSGIDCLVLDEADEMLNMGFLEDVEFVLGRTPENRQIALFSATLPAPIRSIAEQYLSDPAKITVKKKTMTADSIRQRALFVAPRDKVYALGRLLEAEPTDGVIVFTKTKAATLSVAESLCREGRSAVALNGDMPQAARERTVEQFKSGRLDILVATDVAARGLDVSRVSHVINFDLPHDVESYIHRVGRTGRAGRAGEAIIFLSNAQRSRLRTIERATKQRIEVVQLPTADDINSLRIKRFQQQITDVAASEDLTMFKELISLYAAESGKPLEIIAAALAQISQQGRPFLAKDRPQRAHRDQNERREGRSRFQGDRSNDTRGHQRADGRRKGRTLGPPEAGMERFRIEVGRRDGVKPGNIVGAVANEAGIDGEFIGPISIHDQHSTIDLPEGMPRGIYQSLRRTWVSGKQLQIALEGEGTGEGESRSHDRRSHHNKDRKRGKRNGKPGGGFPKGKSTKSGKASASGKRGKPKSTSA